MERKNEFDSLFHETLITAKLKKLIPGNKYYVNALIDNRKTWAKCYFVERAGYEGRLLRFVKKNKLGSTYECFLLSDYIFNRLYVLTKEEYKRRKAQEIFDSIDKLILNAE